MIILLDIVSDIILFPLWWYGEGLKKRFLSVLKGIRAGNRNLALKILILNLFTPMYGEYNWQGRLISFFARLIMLFARGLEMLVWVLFLFALLLLWILAPLLVIWRIFVLF